MVMFSVLSVIILPPLRHLSECRLGVTGDFTVFACVLASKRQPVKHGGVCCQRQKPRAGAALYTGGDLFLETSF